MLFQIENEGTFVPKLRGNRDLPEDQQLTAEIIYPNAEQLKSLSEVLIIRTETDEEFKNTDPGEKRAIAFKTVTNVSKILRNHVGKITNCEGMLNGKKIQILDGKELALTRAKGLSVLVDELTAEVLKDEVPEEKLKN